MAEEQTLGPRQGANRRHCWQHGGFPRQAGAGPLLAVIFFVAGAVEVRADEKIAWKTGAELTKTLRGTIGYSWTDRPLLDGLTALARQSSIAIFLDRRIDPGQRVTSAARDVPLSDALKELASAHQMSVALVGSIVYIAPQQSAGRVQALAAQRKRDAAAVANRQPWLAPRPMEWEELAEPRALAESIADTCGARIKNPEKIPHDVWGAWSGPSLAVVDQLTLVLAGFDLTFELQDEGRLVEIVDAPATLAYEQSYAVTGLAASVASQLQRKMPEIKAVPDGSGRVRVTGNAEQHAAVTELLAGNRAATRTVVKPGEKRYTLTVSNEPVGAIVRTIAKELEVEVKADASLIEKLSQRTSIEVKQVSADELLRKVLAPAGIQFKLTDKALELTEQEGGE